MQLLQLAFRACPPGHEGFEHGLGLSDALGGAGSCSLLPVSTGLSGGCSGDVVGHFGPFPSQAFEVSCVFQVSRGAGLVGSLQGSASLVDGVAGGRGGGPAGLNGQHLRCDRSVVLGACGEGRPGQPREGDAEGDGGQSLMPEGMSSGHGNPENNAWCGLVVKGILPKPIPSRRVHILAAGRNVKGGWAIEPVRETKQGMTRPEKSCSEREFSREIRDDARGLPCERARRMGRRLD